MKTIRRDRLNRYTRPVSDELIQRIEQHRPRTKDQLNRIWYGYHNRQPQHYDNSRYHVVNLHNVWYRGTVEFVPCFAVASLRDSPAARTPFARFAHKP